VEVRGRVVGNVEAQQVKLYETAYVEGDITHGQLSIDVGAYFQGRCQQFRAPAQPTAAVAAAHAPVVQPSFASDAYPASDAPAAQVIELDATHRQ
jgi:cytoskeletal protein CcmA (bactofilin family)